jgi:hypothetical protein
MASMAELARQLLGMNGNSVGGVSPDRYMEIMDRSPYGTGVPLEIGYGEQDQMSPLDAAAIVTGGVPVVGDLTGLAADVDMYMRDPESRNIPNYLLTAAGVLPFLPAASQVRQGIKAYHGSPHSFDQFDSSKIGSGEGAQAYGRGLYLAEREKTAESYRDALTGSRVQSAQSLLNKSGNDVDLAIQSARNEIDRLKSLDLTPETGASKRDSLVSSQEEKLSELTSLKNSGQMSKGSMYEVNIDAKPDELLDWDLPLDEQPENIRKALEKTDWYQYAEEGAYEAANNRGDNPYGMDLVRYLEQDGAEDAANMMKEAGIKGIQYADAQTRFGKGPKTKNYVIFDPRLISIAKKYGIAIPAAAAMLARQTGEDTSQSYQEAS